MLICVTYICPTFLYNSTGCNCTGSHQQFSACVLFFSSSIEITSIAKPALVCFVLSMTITSRSASTSSPLRLQSQRLPLLAYVCVCVCVCAHVAFQRKHPCSVWAGQVLWGDGGPIFQLAALVRSLPGTQIAGIDFAQPQ